MMKKKISEIRDAFRAANGSEGLHGVVGFHFAICTVLYVRNGGMDIETDEALARWEYHPGASEPTIVPNPTTGEGMVESMLDEYPTEALIGFGDVLERYGRRLRAKGHEL